MLSPKENFLETIKKGGRPDRLVSCYNAIQIFGGDPIAAYLFGNRVRGTDSYDRFGTLISFPADQPSPVPIVTPENQVIQDIEEWRDYLKFPDLIENCSEGWEASIANRAACSEGLLATKLFATGIFEQLHQLMTFEDTLCNFLMYPDEMHELIEAITDWKMTYLKMIVEHLHPEMLLSHDDWGSQNSLMMSPEVWREFFKEPYRRMYDYCHENGIIVMHHSDSFCEPIVGDMADIGIDIWQGVLPSNDIVRLTKELDGRMALMGGIESNIDRADASEDEIRTEVRRALREYGELPNFIPSYTYGGLGTLFPHVEPIIHEEIRAYNLEHFGVAD